VVTGGGSTWVVVVGCTIVVVVWCVVVVAALVVVVVDVVVVVELAVVVGFAVVVREAASSAVVARVGAAGCTGSTSGCRAKSTGLWSLYARPPYNSAATAAPTKAPTPIRP
jgi:hypothetical protein